MRNNFCTGTRSLFSRLRVLLIVASLASAMPYSPLLPLCAWTASEALAAQAEQGSTWQWKKVGGRERIVIDVKNQGTQPVEIQRSSLNTLHISVPHVSAQAGQPVFLQGQNPAPQSLVGAMQSTEGGLELALTTSAFGFLATQVSPQQVVIDVFSDPLGARWKADGSLAPVGTKAQTFSVAQPSVAEDMGESVPQNTSQSIATLAVAQEGDLPIMQAVVLDVPSSLETQASATTMPNITEQPLLAAAEIVNETKGKIAPRTASESGSKPAPLPEKLPAKENTNAAATANTVAAEPAPTPAPEKKLEKEESSAKETSSSEASSDASPTIGTDAGAKAEVKTSDTQDALPESTDTSETATSTEPTATSTPAEETSVKDDGTVNTRGTVISPQQVQGPINLSGPEYWPADAGIATNLDSKSAGGQDTAGSAADSSSASSTSGTASTGDEPETFVEPQDAALAENAQKQQSMDMVQTIDPATKPVDPNAVAEEPRPVIYQDEEGNVVPAPPVLEDVFAEAMKLIQEAKYKDALPLLEQLLTMPDLTADQREQVLYHRSDAVESIYTGKPFEGFEDIVQATNEAMNANLRSTRVPDALHRLGMAHLNVGNLAEAEGYFKALRRRYPYDMHVPVDFHLLGKAKMEKGFFAEAEKIFREVLQEYPDSPAVKDGTIALVQALVGQKKFDEALVYADFADKRWARYYIDDPEYLLTLADIDYNIGKKEDALQKYWLLYNLRPTDASSPDILTRIGDLYFELQQQEPALEVFADVLVRFPDTDAGALALLRLSEKGLYDSPLDMATMFGVFENPGMPLPQVTYQDLYKERPTDARSITALLKYALWQLWDKQYAESMGTAADFIDLYPENTDVELARDAIMRGFMADLKNSLIEENHGRILTLWNGFPLVRERYGEIDPDLRNALARGYLERGDDAKAMELFAQFLQTPKHPKYSDPTFALYFNKYLETGNWNAMLDLGELVKDWDMTAAMRGQLDYAMALSAENLGLRERSLKLWHQLAADMEIPKYQRAYATYFLAKDAEERKDIKDAYSYNLKTLQLFDELKQERSDRADEGRRKEAMGALMDITEVANRIPEALEWVERYNQFVDAKSPEYPGLRFREARLYRKLGNAEKAKQLLELIASGYADSPFAAAASTELATFEVSRDLQNFIPQNR